MGRIDFVIAIGADQQQMSNVRLQQQVFEQIKRRQVDPLQVIEKQSERMFRREKTLINRRSVRWKRR